MLYIFYHVYCDIGALDIVKSQLTNILFSGLYKHVDKIHVFLAGKEEHINTIESMVLGFGDKYSIAEKGINDTTYERFTLEKIANYVTNDDKFCYIHSKGVTHVHDYNNHKSNSVWWWRTYMEYFLFTEYEKRIAELEEWDTTGVNWYDDTPHYSGNMWWCRGDYWLKLPQRIGAAYNDPEFHIGKGNGKHLLIRHSNTDHYMTVYYPINYLDKSV